MISPQSVIPDYSAQTGLVYLLEIDRGSASVPLPLGAPDAVAGGSVSGLKPVQSTAPVSVARVAYFASEDITFPTNDLVAPNRWYDGRLERTGQLTRAVNLAGITDSGYSASFGSAVLANGDGLLDVWQDVPDLVNSRATIKVGQRTFPYNTFQVIATGFVLGVDVNEETAVLELGGIEKLLDKEFESATYAGTGGLEGPASLKGVRKPLVLGQVHNIAPIPIEPNSYIYQASSGPLFAVSDVRHGGSSLVSDGDFPDLAALQAYAPAIGHFGTALSVGCIKVGLTQGNDSSAFAVTMDCRTAEVTASKLALLLAQEVQGRFGVPYNAATFAQMEAEDGNFVYGRWLSDPVTYEELLSSIMSNMNRYWGANRRGEISTLRLNDPATAAASGLTYDQADLLDVNRVSLPDGFKNPLAALPVHYGRNYTLQNSLAFVASPEYSVEWKTFIATAMPEVPNSVAAEAYDSELSDEASASALADRVLALHGKARKMYAVQVSVLSGVPGMLESVVLTYPRFGLQDGVTAVVVASAEDYDTGVTNLTLWG